MPPQFLLKAVVLEVEGGVSYGEGLHEEQNTQYAPIPQSPLKL